MIHRQFGALVALALALAAMPAGAQQAPRGNAAPAPAAKAAPGTPLVGFGANSKEPIKVDSNRLEVFDKENRAIFIGDVVAVQGQTTMRCSQMTVLYTGNRGQQGQQPAPPPARQAATAGAPAPAQSGGNSIRQIDCEGPVSLLSGTQSATSEKLVYEADKDIVTLTGKVVIADCDNVQRGERAVYDVKTGKAVVDAGPRGGRVQGVFTPGGDDKRQAAPAGQPKPTDCPAKGSPAPAAAAQPARAAPANNSAPLPLRPQAPATRG